MLDQLGELGDRLPAQLCDAARYAVGMDERSAGFLAQTRRDRWGGRPTEGIDHEPLIVLREPLIRVGVRQRLEERGPCVDEGLAELAHRLSPGAGVSSAHRPDRRIPPPHAWMAVARAEAAS
jgi:hypothetical protein